MPDIDVLTRTLNRERCARKAAEQLLERKSIELYHTNEELRTTAAELKVQAERTQSILDTVAEGIIVYDGEGIIELFNPAAEQIFRCSHEQVVGRRICGFQLAETGPLAGTEATCAADLATPHTNGSDGRVEARGRRFDGETFWMDVSVSTWETENQSRSTLLVRDITLRKELERQLAHAQKMESVGQLAAGIAHEINTPIQYVGDNARFLQDAFSELARLLDMYDDLSAACKSAAAVDRLLERIQHIVEASDIGFLRGEIPIAIEQLLEGSSRVAGIVGAMRDFSHPGSRHRQPVDLNHAIESTIIVSRNEWKYVADLRTDFDPNLPAVPCLADEFNQVVLNLIVNAAHAVSEAIDRGLAERGLITVVTRRTEDWAEIRIGDTGAGIPEGIRDRVFDPFFTTKTVGKGTGQGLAIAYSVIVEKHNGTIEFESTAGKGTTFIVRIPLKEFSEPHEESVGQVEVLSDSAEATCVH